MYVSPTWLLTTRLRLSNYTCMILKGIWVIVVTRTMVKQCWALNGLLKSWVTHPISGDWPANGNQWSNTDSSSGILSNIWPCRQWWSWSSSSMWPCLYMVKRSQMCCRNGHKLMEDGEVIKCPWESRSSLLFILIHYCYPLEVVHPKASMLQVLQGLHWHGYGLHLQWSNWGS